MSETVHAEINLSYLASDLVTYLPEHDLLSLPEHAVNVTVYSV